MNRTKTPDIENNELQRVCVKNAHLTVKIQMNIYSETPLDHGTIEEEQVSEAYTSLDKTAFGMAILSFVLGTLILVLFLVNKDQTFVMIGLYYLITAFIINALMLVTLLVSLIYVKGSRAPRVKAIGALLLNIPIAYGYFILVANSGF